MSKNLVELMAKAHPHVEHVTQNEIDVAIEMLSVVKEHIGEIAEVCPECEGQKQIGNEYTEYKTCKNCKGIGVIARTDGGGK